MSNDNQQNPINMSFAKNFVKKFLPTEVEEDVRSIKKFYFTIIFIIFFVIIFIFNQLHTLWGKSLYVIFVMIPYIPVLFYSLLKNLSTSVDINTEFGRGECKMENQMTDYYSKLVIYYEKLTEQNFEKQNLFKKIFNIFNPKYSKKLYITGENHKITTFYTNVLKYQNKKFNLEEIIKENNFSFSKEDLSATKEQININKSNVSQLGKIPFINKELAVKIVMYIQKNGEFESVWDFADFINFPQEQINLLLKYVYIEKTSNENVSLFLEENNLKGDNPMIDPNIDI